MVTDILLENFKSFGKAQRVPLRPITVVVGPNNSGKSNFLSVGNFVRASLGYGDRQGAVKQAGGPRFLFHRPAVGDGTLRLGWTLDDGRSYSASLNQQGDHVVETEEEIITAAGRWVLQAPSVLTRGPLQASVDQFPLAGLRELLSNPVYRAEAAESLAAPLASSRLIKLSLGSLREDAAVVPHPTLSEGGSGLASVMGLWRGFNLERAERLDDFVHRCLPEIKHVLVRPAPQPSMQRLWIEQVDGEWFDAEHVSDGVLLFIAIAMHVIDAPRGAILFVEQPEDALHPRRLSDLADYFRQVVEEYQCQFVIATHSPILLNEFRDEPESILLFRRTTSGTEVRQLSEVPELLAALDRAPPGDMLANGFFNEAA